MEEKHQLANTPHVCVNWANLALLDKRFDALTVAVLC